MFKFFKKNFNKSAFYPLANLLRGSQLSDTVSGDKTFSGTITFSGPFKCARSIEAEGVLTTTHNDTSNIPIARISGLTSIYSGEFFEVTITQRGTTFSKALFTRQAGNIYKIHEISNGYTLTAKMDSNNNTVEFYTSENITLDADNTVKVIMLVANDFMYGTITIGPTSSTLTAPFSSGWGFSTTKVTELDLNSGRVIFDPTPNSPVRANIKIGDGTGWKTRFTRHDGSTVIAELIDNVGLNIGNGLGIQINGNTAIDSSRNINGVRGTFTSGPVLIGHSTDSGGALQILNVSRSSVNTTYTSAFFGTLGTLFRAGGADSYILGNLYYTSTPDWKYSVTGGGVILGTNAPSAGDFIIETTPSGTAGTAATLTKRLILQQAGDLTLGSTAGTGVGTLYAGSLNGSQNAHVGAALSVGTLYLDSQSGYGSRSSKMWINYSASDTNTNTWSGGAGLTIHNDNTTEGNWSTLAFSTYEGTNGNNVAGAAIRARFTSRVIGGWAKGDLAFFTMNHTGLVEAMRIDSSGELTLGGTSQGRFHILDASDSYMSYINLGAKTARGWQFGKNNNNGAIGPTGGFYIYELTGGATRFVIANGGNVGIGDLSPTEGRLVVRNASGAGQPVIGMYQGNANSNLIEGYNSSDTNTLYVSENGNLWVNGTITAGSKLVTAKGRQRNVAVKSDNYTATLDDEVIIFTHTGSTKTLTMPQDPPAGTTIEVYNTGSSATLNINAGSGDTINGGPGTQINSQGQMALLTAQDTSNWVAITANKTM